MKKFFVYVSVVLVSVLFLACAPFSKESYLERYEEFMNEISENSSNYTEKDWAEKSEEFQRLSQEWYQKFEQELTAGEKMRLAGYEVKYTYYYSMSAAKNTLDSVLNEINVDDMKSKVKDFIENDLPRDVEKLGEDMVTVGTQAAESLQEMCDGIQSKVDSLSHVVDAWE